LPIFLNTMPKSGSNLVSKLFDIFGVPYGKVGIAPTLLLGDKYYLKQVARRSFLERSPSIVGLDVQVPVRKAWLLRKLRSVSRDAYITGHLNWTPVIQKALDENNFKSVLVIRDPLDTLVSYCHYIGGSQEHFLHPYFRGLSLRDSVSLALEPGSLGNYDYLGFGHMLDQISVWAGKSSVHVVKFEDIVGEAGGGSRGAQERALAELGAWVGLNFDQDIVEDQLFGGTKTFRQGKIGSASLELDPELRAKAEDILQKYIYQLGYCKNNR